MDAMKEPYRSWSLVTLRQTKFLTLFRHWDVEEIEDETVCLAVSTFEPQVLTKLVNLSTQYRCFFV
jgi:hypothetical protein